MADGTEWSLEYDAPQYCIDFENESEADEFANNNDDYFSEFSQSALSLIKTSAVNNLLLMVDSLLNVRDRCMRRLVTTVAPLLNALFFLHKTFGN